MRAKLVAAIAGALSLPAALARADVHELRHDVGTDVAVTATAVVLVVGSELGKASLVTGTCRWCDRDDEGHDDLNGVDRGVRDALRWRSPQTAAHVSDAVGFLGATASAAGTLALAGSEAGASGARTGVDELLLLETVSVSAVVNQLVKLTVLRERPFVHALPDGEKGKTAHPADNDLSFYSGHTGLTMTLAAAGGTLATLRGYRLAPLVWGSGAAISLFTGYLRIAADKHYFTDVLTGALVGAAVGVLVPVLFHGRRDDARAPATPSPPGLVTLGASF